MNKKQKSSTISSFKFGKEDNICVCGHDDGTIVIWDIRRCDKYITEWKGHNSPIWDLNFSKGNGSLLVTGILHDTSFSKKNNHIFHFNIF